MKDAGVDFVTTCMDTNGVVTLAKEMKKQSLKAVQYLPNAYDHDFLDEFGDLFEGSYVRTDFVPLESPGQAARACRATSSHGQGGGKKPARTRSSAGSTPTCSSPASRRPGPEFSRQKVIDAINKMTNYTADGILAGVDWTMAHTDGPTTPGAVCQFFSKIDDSKFVPVFSRARQAVRLRVDRTAPTPPDTAYHGQ